MKTKVLLFLGVALLNIIATGICAMHFPIQPDLIGKWYSKKNSFLSDSAIQIRFSKDTMEIVHNLEPQKRAYWVDSANILNVQEDNRVRQYRFEIRNQELTLSQVHKTQPPPKHIELILTVKYKK